MLHFKSPDSSSPSRTLGELAGEGNGYFSGQIADATPGTLYKFELDSGAFPDPASRFQPTGPHGPSQVIDPAFAWSDQAWRGIAPGKEVIYELHVGTFTPEGTWNAATAQLPELASLGITIVEVMPVADFDGRFGWGYDGVCLFAPTRLYGPPDDFRAFVDRAHSLGLGVILDVVYNHFGPSGNYFRQFSDDYFSSIYKNEWGEPINFDGNNSGPVREFFEANAACWTAEFHLDGLRLDATHAIFDSSKINIIAGVSRAARAAAPGRRLFIAAENEEQTAHICRPIEKQGHGIDALWNEDFHHAALVAATGRAEAYYSDFRGTPQELVSCARHGFLFQGQWSSWQKKRRGSRCPDLNHGQFIAYLQNHDQVANSRSGTRLHQLTSPGRLRALTALLLLAPHTPLLFQGQEFAASAPFYYFANHDEPLASLVRQGRLKFLQQYPSIHGTDDAAALPDPNNERTFLSSKINFQERDLHAPIYRLHRDLLAMRRNDTVFAATSGVNVDGAVLGLEAFVLRFEHQDAERLLLLNLGPDLQLYCVPEPLLAPPPDSHWSILWSSEDSAYGGQGTRDFAPQETWILPSHTAIVLQPRGNQQSEARPIA